MQAFHESLEEKRQFCTLMSSLNLTDVVASTICTGSNIFSRVTPKAHHEDGCFFELIGVPELERAEATRSKDVVQRAVGFEI
jgi:hypothetical protein